MSAPAIGPGEAAPYDPYDPFDSFDPLDPLTDPLTGESMTDHLIDPLTDPLDRFRGLPPLPASPISPITPPPPTSEGGSGDGRPRDARLLGVPRPGPVAPSSGPITQPTMMIRVDAGGSDWTGDRRPAGDGDGDGADSESAGPMPSLVRPYTRTGGRTKPGLAFDLEALVRTTVTGREAWHSPLLTPEHTSVIELSSGTVSVAEIAARLAVPLGVARVIIADMVDLGLVEVLRTSASIGDERDPAFLRRVLSGLQRL